MNRLSLVLVALVGILAGGLGVSLLRPAGPGLADGDVRGIVNEMVATGKLQSQAALDPKQVNTLLESYLLNDPDILERMNNRLADEKASAQRKAMKDTIDAHYADIYQAPDAVVLGNPKGDVTLVEMFDYNCVYCRQALPDMAQLIQDDPKLRIILRQFPILTQGSIEAARVAILVSENPKINYWDFHQKLFAMRAGTVDAGQALQVAEQVGGDRAELMVDMDSNHTTDAIQQSYSLAKALNINGTPSYILGDELIFGALPLDQMKAKIANLRACGSTDCPASKSMAPTG
jgi:protein-disulfide isomerase